jgi:hypothetical protein
LKRFTATGLVLLLLYHMLGQALTVWIDEWQSNRQLADRLSVYHSTDDLVEFEIPVPLHQYGATTTEETGGGEFEYGGQFYRIVRQQLRNDTLHLFCFQDSEKLQRRTDLSDFIQRNITGDDQNAPQKNGTVAKAAASDYAQRLGGWLVFVYEDCFSAPLPSPSYALTAALLSRPSPPPQRLV